MTPMIPYRQTALSLALSAFVAASAFVSTTADAAQTSGSEFLVNTYTSGSQQRPGIAVDANGDFVVFWVGPGAATPSSNSIYGQRYSRDGSLLSGNFRLFPGIGNNTYPPRVAMDADGDFVAVYAGIGSGDTTGIYGLRYDKAGTAQGSEFRVNTYITSGQIRPSIAMDADGDFVVTWQSNLQDGSGYGIYAQRYNASGVAQGTEFRVNTTATSSQARPSIAMDADGDFVVAWQSNLQDGFFYGVYAQRYNASGVAQGTEFRVNTYITNSQQYPAIAMDADGDFVIAWASTGQDGSSDGVYAQRYNASGVAQGTEFRVNTYILNNQTEPSVAMDADGDFVIAWSSYRQDTSGDGVYAQRYNAAGTPVGSEFRVSTYTAGSQNSSSIAMDADGDFVVAWMSPQDGNGIGIYAQRYSADTVGSSFTASAGAPTINAGVYSFTATYCLKAGQPTLANLGSYTLALSNGNSLDSRTTSAYAVPGQAAVPPGGVGSQQDAPATGQYADRALTTGECIAVPYAIGLANSDKFSFSVRLRGDNGGTPAAP